MKTANQIISALVMVSALLFLPAAGASAEDVTDGAAGKRAKFEALVDQYIQSREAKQAMLASRSEEVRKEAVLSCDKAEFCRIHRERLVNELMSGGCEPRSERVNLYLHQEYFRAIAEGAFASSR